MPDHISAEDQELLDVLSHSSDELVKVRTDLAAIQQMLGIAEPRPALRLVPSLGEARDDG